MIISFFSHCICLFIFQYSSCNNDDIYSNDETTYSYDEILEDVSNRRQQLFEQLSLYMYYFYSRFNMIE